MTKLVAYVKACGGSVKQLKGWTAHSMKSAGRDSRFMSPEGTTVIGRSEVARALGLTPLDRYQAAKLAHGKRVARPGGITAPPDANAVEIAAAFA